ncbi:enoyl-CoA hydratase/isomerase family protein [Pseudomonas sp. R37(2017)]|uniref:enoyl-CoA hydratase/isomerase family protein n=1 Tax=Pseudomonas sp. R37(2017) TaxID=1981685 RepID=UPI000A1DDED4|nr:enoyl-CoA hydratase/isomerase family protein [Pseudomonas sp. R37(2017)]
MTTLPSTIELTIDDGLATLTLSRPERKNALTVQMFAELLDALLHLRRNPDVRAVLLTGAGDAFCSGGDVNNMGGSVEATNVRASMVENNRLLSAMADFDKPLIAAVDGVAFGAGFSLALAADFVIASERARFCMAFARVGLGPDLGASFTLPRVVGLQRAKELLYSAREVGAQEALALGIALEVHPVERFRARAEALARSMANMSTAAFFMTKRLLGRTFENDLAAQLDAEAAAQAVLLGSSYTRDASARFARKEAPRYQWPQPSPVEVQ